MNHNSTIKSKPKPCKGTSKAIGHGCGKSALNRKYGLCRDCLVNWSLTTNEGNEYIRSLGVKAKKKVEKEEKQRIKSEKEAIKKKSAFEADLQKEVNKIARYIDFNKGCISCEQGHSLPFTRKKNGGHYYSVGSNASLRFNLLNIRLQCERCNSHLGGNDKNYRNGILSMYGDDELFRVESLVEQYPLIKLSIDDLKECIKKARQIIRDIEKGKDYTREQVNNTLGIYK